MLFRLAPGIDWVPMNEETVLFVSDGLRLKLEGASAAFFATTLAPRLARWASVAELVRDLPQVDDAELLKHLRTLEAAGLIQRHVGDSVGPEATIVSELMGLLGAASDADAAQRRLGELRVTIFGLEHVGAYLAAQLAPLGLRHLRLVDPFDLTAQDALAWPFPVQPGRPREACLFEVLTLAGARAGVAGSIESSGAPAVTRELVDSLAQQSDLLVGTFDRGFLACHHWINRAALRHGTPAVFAAASGVVATIGPWVFPGESACYMCWRMRNMAALPGFDKTMAYERHLDRAHQPLAGQRPTLPGLAASTAGLLCSEILTTMLGMAVPSLANAIVNVHALDKTVTRHQFLHRPDCPDCAGIHQAVQVGAAVE